VESDTPLEVVFESPAEATVERDVDFEVSPDNSSESIVLVCTFSEVTAEMSLEFCSSKFRKSFSVTSLPLGVMMFIVLLLYAASAVDCAVEIRTDCDVFLEVSVDRLVFATVESETALEAFVERFVPATVERDAAREASVEELVVLTVTSEVFVELAVDKFVEATVESEAPREVFEDKFAEATVEREAFWEFSEDRLSLTLRFTD